MSSSQDSGFQGRNIQVPGTQFKGPGCPGSQDPGTWSRVPRPRDQSSGFQGPRSQFLILDYARNAADIAKKFHSFLDEQWSM